MSGKIQCDECKRKFPSRGALAMHNRAKHGGHVVQPLVMTQPVAAKPKRRIFGAFTFACLLMVVLSAGLFLASTTKVEQDKLGGFTEAIHGSLSVGEWRD